MSLRWRLPKESEIVLETYDEAEITARLVRLDRSRRTAFVAACAERLWPLFERYSLVTGCGDAADLRTVLDQAWTVAQGGDAVDLESASTIAEELVPSDEGEWVFEMGYGQNAAAAVAYAVRTWLTDDPQEGVWGTRQVYEAADYAAQHSLPDFDPNAVDAERRLLESSAVQSALAGLATDLAAVESSAGDGWAALRERAEREGRAWARTLV